MKTGLHREARSSRALRGALGLALVLTAVPGCKSEPDEWASTADFKNPEELQPEGGVYKLVAGSAEVSIEGKRYCLRTYNGKLTGPTIRVSSDFPRPRRIRVDLANAFLQANTPHEHTDSASHQADFNTTNLHTHGLHVSPEKTADGEFTSDDVVNVALGPQQSKSYRFDIDAGEVPHRPGTFWYHPHVHGSTAIQVANGMAGALIIEGDVDQLPGIRDARERIFMLQQIPYDYEDARPLGDGERCDDTKLSINDATWVNKAPRTLVNGIPRPLITLPPGQVERWRFIHAGTSQFVNVTLYKGTDEGCSASDKIEPLKLRQIAADGITFSEQEERDNVLLAPGYRADVMVQAPQEEGTYCLLDAQSPKLDPQGPTDTDPEPASLLAVLKVDKRAGTPPGTKLPENTDLKRVAPSVPECDSNTSREPQKVVFAQEKDDQGQDCSTFTNINCKEYNANVIRQLTLGATDYWQVSSDRGNHPFHIHVNPFVVCKGETVNGETVQKAYWKDTLYIREKENVRLRTTYEDFTGKFVTHCHLLQHEDNGMMEAMNISASPSP